MGTSGRANIGRHYLMYEVIHDTAPRIVETGRVEYADPSSFINAAVLLINHIGFVKNAKNLEMVFDICSQFESKKRPGLILMPPEKNM